LKYDDAEAANFSETCATQPPTTETIGTSAPSTAAPVTEVPLAIAAPVTEAPASVPVTEAPTTTQPVTYLVSNVVDGDTIDVTGSDGGTFPVRIIGIDTPEMGACEGPAARNAALFILQGKTVTLTRGIDGEDTDKYGRYLRHVTVDGVDYGLTMIQLGQAIARYDGRDGYGVQAFEDEYHAADDATPDYSCPPPTTPAPPTTQPRPTTAPAPVAPPPPPPPPSNNVYYANCDAVRAAGAAPIYPGDPGWQTKFDRNHDGVGCE
jgi:endonuclease YncB( thermonuclease family)